jgi:hypothetical protein
MNLQEQYFLMHKLENQLPKLIRKEFYEEEVICCLHTHYEDCIKVTITPKGNIDCGLSEAAHIFYDLWPDGGMVVTQSSGFDDKDEYRFMIKIQEILLRPGLDLGSAGE